MLSAFFSRRHATDYDVILSLPIARSLFFPGNERSVRIDYKVDLHTHPACQFAKNGDIETIILPVLVLDRLRRPNVRGRSTKDTRRPDVVESLAGKAITGQQRQR